MLMTKIKIWPENYKNFIFSVFLRSKSAIWIGHIKRELNQAGDQMEYNVTLLNEATGDRNTLCVPDGEYIYDIAEAKGLDLPASCRAGKCISCAGKVMEGQIKSDSSFLKKDEENAGFMLLCCSYALSDCTIAINQEDELLNYSTN